MPKSRILIFIVVVLAVALAFYFNIFKSKEADVPAVEKQQEVSFYFFPLPTFEQIFKSLTYLNSKDYDKAIAEDIPVIENSSYKAAFALGMFSADAIIAVEGRNKQKVQKISQEMIKFSKTLGLNEDILKLADELQILVKEDKWNELKKTLDTHKSKVEHSLYDSREYDTFILLQAGGWTEGLNRMAYLLSLDFKTEKTQVIRQLGILDQLIKNLKIIPNENIKKEEFYTVTLSNLEQIHAILKTKEGNYTAKEINSILELTQKTIAKVVN